VLSLNHPFTLKEIHGKNCRMAAVAAAESQLAALEIGKTGDGPAGDCDDFGHPAQIRITHRNRPAAALAPHVGLDIGEIGVPADVDARQGIAGRGEEGRDLRLVTLKQHHFDGQMRLLMEVAPHTLPDAHYLRIIGDGTHPDCSAHDCSPVHWISDALASRIAPRTAVFPEWLCR